MVLDRDPKHSLSAAFFCPQSRAVSEDYLTRLQFFLSENHLGRTLLDEVGDLHTAWEIFAKARNDIEELSEGSRYVDMLQDWARHGVSAPIAEARSAIVSLPLLVILQIGQYLRYLESHSLSHLEFLAEVHDVGGLQRYCGGLPSAIAIACASSETELVKNAAKAIRVVLGIGAYATVADEKKDPGPTTLAVRIRHEGQGEDLVRRFPGVSPP